jgi:haloalkane dehalogenase
VPLEPGHPTWALLREISHKLDGWNVPTQLIWGLHDPVFVPWFLEEFEKRLPNHAPSHLIEDASHFLQDDNPEQINAKIREFLQNTASRYRPLSLVVD